jgi:hypothetical protein
LAVERLVLALGERLPGLVESLNEPVSNPDLAALKRAIDPFSLPSEMETWLQFADGQRVGAPPWPVVDVRLRSASEMVELYEGSREFHPPGLLPIGYESHYEISIELASDKSPMLIDTTVSSVEWLILSPSLPGMFDVATHLVLARDLDDWLDYPRMTAEQYTLMSTTVASRTMDQLSRLDWTGTPFRQDEYFRMEDGPLRWGPMPAV